MSLDFTFQIHLMSFFSFLLRPALVGGYWPANTTLYILVQFKILSGIHVWTYVWVHVHQGSSGPHNTTGGDDQQILYGSDFSLP